MHAKSFLEYLELERESLIDPEPTAHQRMERHLAKVGGDNCGEKSSALYVEHVPLDALVTFGVPTEGTRKERLRRKFGVPVEGDLEPLSAEDEGALQLLMGYPETTPQRNDIDAVFIPGEGDEEDLIVVTDGLHRLDVIAEIRDLGHDIGVTLVVRPGDWFTAMTQLIEATEGKPELGVSRRYAWYETLWEKTAPEELRKKMDFIQAFAVTTGLRKFKEEQGELSRDERKALEQWMSKANDACDVRPKKKKEELTHIDRTEYSTKKRHDERLRSWAVDAYDQLGPLQNLDPKQRNQLFDYQVTSWGRLKTPDAVPPPARSGYVTTEIGGIVAKAFPDSQEMQTAVLEVARADTMSKSQVTHWTGKLATAMQADDQELIDELLGWDLRAIKANQRLEKQRVDPDLLLRDVRKLSRDASTLLRRGVPSSFEKKEQLDTEIQALQVVLGGLAAEIGLRNDDETTSESYDNTDESPGLGVVEDKDESPMDPWNDMDYGLLVEGALNYITGRTDRPPRSLGEVEASIVVKGTFQIATTAHLSESDINSERYEEVARWLK